MALTRKFLKSMGLSDEQVDSIIEAHTEVTDALKGDLAKYKQDSEQLSTVQKELDDLKATSGKDGFEEKYKAEKTAFEEFKAKVESDKLTAAKTDALRGMLDDAGINRDLAKKLIEKSYDMNSITFEDGKVKDRDQLIQSIKTDYAEFVGNSQTSGVPANNPPVGGSGSALNIDAIRRMSADEINKNWAAVSTALANQK